MRFLVVLCLAMPPMVAQAGVFYMPKFVEEGRFALGLEPELTLTHGAGLGFNLKYKHGLSDLVNAGIGVGNGGGERKFRLGGSLTFDFFPDHQGQPGVGIGTQAFYYKVPAGGRLEGTIVPYIHKSFFSAGGSFEPYLALPFGARWGGEKTDPIVSISVGSMFQKSEHLTLSLELGVAINNTDTYMSGGVVYFH